MLVLNKFNNHETEQTKNNLIKNKQVSNITPDISTDTDEENYRFEKKDQLGF